ncbi:hypothetical protein HDU98_009044 [Podochytrium sp. JEL0797]|nr:hypothetical protein HDU98_009044 [Podochytrium sp. JEL0797]
MTTFDPPSDDPDPTAFAQQLVRDRVKTFTSASPLTASHLALCLAGHSLALVGLVPLRAQSFHPRLALSPAWQLHRIPSSLCVLGRSLPQFAGSVVSMVTWHAQLESLVNGSGDSTKNGRIVKRGTRPKSKSILEFLLSPENQFLRIQLSLAAATVLLEILLYSDPKDAVLMQGSSVLSRAVLVFPYSLFPVFDAAIRWTWAFLELEKDTLIFGVVPVRPIYVPLVTSLMGGGSVWSLAKGFVVAVAVSTGLKLKRGGRDLNVGFSLDGGDAAGGELVSVYLRDFGSQWYRWIRSAFKKLTSPKPSPASSTPPSKKSYASAASTPGTSSTRPNTTAAPSAPEFNISDAAAFFDATVLPAIGPFVAEARDALVRAANGFVAVGEEEGAPEGVRRRAGGAGRRLGGEGSGARIVQMEELEEK